MSQSHESKELDSAVALSLWAPRMILGGVEPHDVQTVTAMHPRWADWLDVWSEIGLKHRRVAEQQLAHGENVSAGQAFRRACACYHFAKFVWALDERKNAAATQASVECGNAALVLQDAGYRRIDVGDGPIQVVANLRYPKQGNAPHALVVLVPGLDSTKEELMSWGDEVLARGMASLTVDGPGQGEVFHRGTRIQSAYERTLKLALDAIADDRKIDQRRIGIAGTSLGGHYVIRGAAFEPRVRAVVSVSGPFKIELATAPAHTVETVKFYSRSASDEAAAQYMQSFDLTAVTERVTQPARIATGRKDRIVPWEQTEAIARAMPRGQFSLYDDGNHGLTNLAHEFRAVSADWLKSTLAEG